MQTSAPARPPLPAARCFVGAIFGGLACLAAGCIGPTYHRPDIPPPKAWQESTTPETPAAAKVPDAGPVWPAADWWHGFGSPQLDELIEAAQHGNDDLAAAIARVEEADAQVRIAGAPLLPSLDLGATAARERAQVTGEGPKVFNAFSPELSASYELDFWGKNRALRNAARAAAEASRFDRETVALTLVSSVATTYLQALELRDRIRVAQENLANGRKILDGFRLELEAGTATGLDVAQQETTVALLNAAVPPLEQQLRQTVHALAVLIGQTPESVDVDAGTLDKLSSPAVLEGLPSELLARRPDIAEAEQQLIAANADITVARAALFPSIQLTASGGYASSQLVSLVSPPDRVYDIAASLAQPIFHGGALRGQVTYSNARYRELLADYHKAVISAFGNVEDALAGTRQTAEQAKRQEDAVDTARRAYEFAQTQMAAGTVNILTVLNTENALFSAQDQLVQVHYSRLQALVNLYTALGGGWHQG
ncbi:MAG TPA: efflux transporter outer membrane subunit [Steroidobacteraceae bacterium]|jgi:NodT family efflux transporter outer membrane factor (OMF) lipoprotein|nr:efflux transporter outer membrane subunit [Steroidobacteraceae bacterium]